MDKSSMSFTYKDVFTEQNITITREFEKDDIGDIRLFISFMQSVGSAIGFSEETLIRYLGEQ